MKGRGSHRGVTLATEHTSKQASGLTRMRQAALAREPMTCGWGRRCGLRLPPDACSRCAPPSPGPEECERVRGRRAFVCEPGLGRAGQCGLGWLWLTTPHCQLRAGTDLDGGVRLAALHGPLAEGSLGVGLHVNSEASEMRHRAAITGLMHPRRALCYHRRIARRMRGPGRARACAFHTRPASALPRSPGPA